MALKISYDKQLHLLTCKVSAYLSIDDYENALQEILTSKEYPCDVSTLWDLRDMEFDNIDLRFQEKLVEIRQKYISKRAAAKIAIVYENRLAEPLVKMYAILSKDLSQNTRSFTSMGEAMYWLVYGNDTE